MVPGDFSFCTFRLIRFATNNSIPPHQATDNFKLNLFGDDDSGMEGGRSGSGGGGILMFGTHGKNEAYKKQAGLSGMMRSLNVGDQKQQQSTGDDLLDLMDGAA